MVMIVSTHSRSAARPAQSCAASSGLAGMLSAASRARRAHQEHAGIRHCLKHRIRHVPDALVLIAVFTEQRGHLARRVYLLIDDRCLALRLLIGKALLDRTQALLDGIWSARNIDARILLHELMTAKTGVQSVKIKQHFPKS